MHQHIKSNSLYVKIYLVINLILILSRLPETGAACLKSWRDEKCSLLEAYDKLPKTSRDAAEKLNVPHATLCRLLKQRETVMAASDGDRKQLRMGKLSSWLKSSSSSGWIMPGHVMPPNSSLPQ